MAATLQAYADAFVTIGGASALTQHACVRAMILSNRLQLRRSVSRSGEHV